MSDEDLELRAYYLATADARVERLDAAIAEARHRGDAGRDGLRQVVHRVAGSAGTYGFPALTLTARTLEGQLVARALDESLLRAADALLTDMRRAFSQARTALATSASDPAGDDDRESEIELAARDEQEEPAALRPGAGIAPKRVPVVALFVGAGADLSSLAAARAVAAALGQAGVGLVCCGEGPCLSAAAQGYAENGGTAFRHEQRDDLASAAADGVVLLRGSAFEQPAGARGRPMVRASAQPRDAVFQLLEALAREERAAV